MPVKTASRLVARAMKAVMSETIAPANQGTKRTTTKTDGAGHQFGSELHHRLNTYNGSIDEVTLPGKTVDSWRLQLSQCEVELEPANSGSTEYKKQG